MHINTTGAFHHLLEITSFSYDFKFSCCGQFKITNYSISSTTKPQILTEHQSIYTKEAPQWEIREIFSIKLSASLSYAEKKIKESIHAPNIMYQKCTNYYVSTFCALILFLRKRSMHKMLSRKSCRLYIITPPYYLEGKNKQNRWSLQ